MGLYIYIYRDIHIHMHICISIYTYVHSICISHVSTDTCIYVYARVYKSEPTDVMVVVGEGRQSSNKTCGPIKRGGGSTDGSSACHDQTLMSWQSLFLMLLSSNQRVRLASLSQT